MIDLTPDEIARFWANVAKGPDCWEWTSSDRTTRGYGQFTVRRGGRPVRRLAHRVSFALSGRELTPAVRHSCDNPPCVRPEHLLGGTQADNVRDAIERGRLDTSGLNRSGSAGRRRRAGVSPGRSLVLGALVGEGRPITAREVARRTGLHPSTVLDHLRAIGARRAESGWSPP